jgi:hypothetical protein
MIESAVGALERPSHPLLSWNVIKLLILGLVTCGIAPLLVLPRRFQKYVANEQQQLWTCASWVRLHTNHPEADALRERAERIRMPFGFAGIATACAVVAMFCLFQDLRAFSSASVWDRITHFVAPFSSGRPPTDGQLLFFAAICVGYVVGIWFAVHWHTQQVAAYLDVFNRIARREGLEPVRTPPSMLMPRPVFLLAGALPSLYGFVWALPMMLAGGAHRRYIMQSGSGMRAQLARRLRLLLARHAPSIEPPPMRLVRNCQTPLCRSALAGDARFCPRCGRQAEVA